MVRAVQVAQVGVQVPVVRAGVLVPAVQVGVQVPAVGAEAQVVAVVQAVLGKFFDCQSSLNSLWTTILVKATVSSKDRSR